MTSHGVARATRPRTQEQRQIDLNTIERYRSLENQIRSNITAKDYGTDTFNLTSKLLRQNPEYYTIWNVRRRCLISGSLRRPLAGSSPSKVSPSTLATATPTPSSADSLQPSSTGTPNLQGPQIAGKNGTTPEESDNDTTTSTDILEAIGSELSYTVPLLLEFPKCYWIWTYRLWILRQAIERLPLLTARKIWEQELGLVAKLLHKDRRNFHAWGYRRHIVSNLESPSLNGSSMAETEFEYTTKMIHNDLSNFSAWHSRSQWIPQLLKDREADDLARKQFLEKELTLIRGGLNVGPEDQSLWFYHQYLISNILAKDSYDAIAPQLTDHERKSYIQREIDEIKDLLEDYHDVKWIYEALIQTSLAMLKLDSSALGHDAAAGLLDWLRKLGELDPKRSGRWGDMATRVGHSVDHHRSGFMFVG